MKKVISFLTGVAIYVVAIYFLTGYGNRNSHRSINQITVEQFQKNFIQSLQPLEIFKNYTFVFYGSMGLPGTFIEKGGLTQYDVKEIEKKENPASWIVHGGYSADEPEVFASFRHFYDPTEPAGNRYLHNHLDAAGSLNPKIDHLKWAVDHSEHQYNWKNTKASVVAALTSYDKSSRDKNMAFAWRGLGEALHMIADMGCPAHVRDDAHAAENYTGFKLGSPDPYEEIIEELAEEGLATVYKAGKLDIAYRDSFRRADNIEDIASILARYTNQNFFTNQTISGKNIVPLIHPEKTYSSPKLEQCTYDEKDMVYKKSISGNEVLMCTDKRYNLIGMKVKGYPKIDKECAVSQAQALLPQIVEAGTNVMRIFIPNLKVVIDSYDEQNERIKGRVVHTADKEYPSVIKYKGPVSIISKKKLNKITEVECENGIFDVKIDKSDFSGIDWEKYGIFGEIEFGGIQVKSEPYTQAPLKTVKSIGIQAFWKTTFTETINGKTTSTSGEDMAVLTFNSVTTSGNTITGTYSSNGLNASLVLTMSGTNLQSFKFEKTSRGKMLLEGGYMKGENMSGVSGLSFEGITHEVITKYDYNETSENYLKVANKINQDNTEKIKILLWY